jgi:hypothetical protein
MAPHFVLSKYLLLDFGVVMAHEGLFWSANPASVDLHMLMALFSMREVEGQGGLEVQSAN